MLTPLRGYNCWYFINRQEQQVAVLYMDYLEQAHELVLSPDVSGEDAMEALRLTASHTSRYVVNRRHSNGIFEITYGGEYSIEKSTEMIKDGVVPRKIRSLDAEHLKTALRSTGVEVIHAQVNNLREALEAAINDVRLMPVSFKIQERGQVLGHHRVIFNLTPPMQFRAWHNISQPGPDKGFDLYIVPDYHPVMTNTKSYDWLVNGDTDALVTGQAIRSVFAPNEARKPEERSFLSSSWSHVNHPYYAVGSEVSVEVSPTRSLSSEGINEIQSVLLALLEFNNKYLSVSGGFRDPYTHPQNVANQLLISTSSWGGEARGSEGFCVWAHKVLSDEGELARAYVPSWFRSEGWLQAYEAYGLSRR